MGEKGDFRYVIDQESPSTRCMDRTPNTLAKELGITSNSVRKRLESIGNCFGIRERDKSDIQEPYQMYNYEGLPILLAYLKRDINAKGKEGDGPKRKFTTTSRNDMGSFMSSLENYLTEHPEQSCCRKFVYAQKQFQHYWMETHLQKLIGERLHCIELLSHQIILEPTYPKNILELKTYPLYFPALLPGIIKALDRIILYLANYADLERIKGTEAPSIEREPFRNSLDSNGQSVDDLIKEWYCSLKEKRASITNEYSQIFLEGLPDERCDTIADALNKRLLDETLSEEKPRAEAMEKIVEQTQELLEFSRKVEEYKKEEIQSKILGSMRSSSETYIKESFGCESEPISIDTLTEGLPSAILELLREWFDIGVPVTAELRKALQNPCNLNEARKHIQEIWDIMTECNYVPEAQEKELIISTAVESSLIAKERFPILDKSKESLNNFLLNPLKPVDNLQVVLPGCAITLEFFWRKHAETYSRYYTNIYEQYLEALRESRILQEAGR